MPAAWEIDLFVSWLSPRVVEQNAEQFVEQVVEQVFSVVCQEAADEVQASASLCELALVG